LRFLRPTCEYKRFFFSPDAQGVFFPWIPSSGEDLCENHPSRRRKDRRRTCRAARAVRVSPPASVTPAAALRVGVGGGQERRARATAPPPALARPAAYVSGGEGRWCVAAVVCMASGGSACWGGRRARETCTCYCSAAGVGKTGGGRVGWGGALVCRRRGLHGRRRLCVLVRACSGSCPHSQRGITPSENPAQDADRYARVTTRTPGSLGAKRTKTTEATQTQR